MGTACPPQGLTALAPCRRAAGRAGPHRSPCKAELRAGCETLTGKWGASQVPSRLLRPGRPVPQDHVGCCLPILQVTVQRASPKLRVFPGGVVGLAWVSGAGGEDSTEGECHCRHEECGSETVLPQHLRQWGLLGTPGRDAEGALCARFSLEQTPSQQEAGQGLVLTGCSVISEWPLCACVGRLGSLASGLCGPR